MTVPGPHLQDQGDKCASSQSQEVTSLLTQAVWGAAAEHLLVLTAGCPHDCLFPPLLPALQSPPGKREGPTLSAKLLFPRGTIYPRALDGKCSWDTICSSCGNLEGSLSPASLEYFFLGFSHHQVSQIVRYGARG